MATIDTEFYGGCGFQSEFLFSLIIPIIIGLIIYLLYKKYQFSKKYLILIIVLGIILSYFGIDFIISQLAMAC